MASWIQTTTLLSASFITKASHSRFCWRLATHKGNSHTLLVLHGNWWSCPLFISPAPTLHQAPIFSPLDDGRGPLAALPAALLLYLHPHMVRLSSSLATSRTRLLPAVCTGTGAFFGDEHIMLIPATGLLHIFCLDHTWKDPWSPHSSFSSQLSSEMFRKAFPCSLCLLTASTSCIYSTIYSSFTALVRLKFSICLNGLTLRTTSSCVSIMGVITSSMSNNYVWVCVPWYPQYPGQCLWPSA